MEISNIYINLDAVDKEKIYQLKESAEAIGAVMRLHRGLIRAVK